MSFLCCKNQLEKGLLQQGRDWQNEQDRKNVLRQSLLAELRTMVELDPEFSLMYPDLPRSFEDFHPGGIHTGVYDSNLGKLGLLSEQEVQNLVSFYNLLEYSQYIKFERPDRLDNLSSDERKETLRILKSQRQDTIDQLEKNL